MGNKPPTIADARVLQVAEPAGAYETRYQVGYAQHLRDALPNATFVAFTGTPVSSEDRDTRAVFGDYIHVYDMQQAKEDGATVAIYFESRLAKLSLKQAELPQIDDEVDELAEDEEEASRPAEEPLGGAGKGGRRRAAHRQRAGRSGRALRGAQQGADRQGDGRGHEPRDLRPSLQRDRQAAARLARRRPGKGRHQDRDDRLGQRQGAAAPAHLQRQVKKRLEKRFKDPADPLQAGDRARHVADRLRRALRAHLYVDKPMKGHNLMQAIARVNRVFKDKQGGLVVDYIGIANELKSALKEYTASKGRGRPTVDAAEAYAVLEEKLDILRAMLLHGFDYSDFLTAGHKRLAGAANHVLDQGRQEALRRHRAGDEQGVHAVLHAG
jgi:type I restriction enzyme R subunit